jgi:ADA HAT complex component 1
MIIKRKIDGQLVKLVCLDCRRFDFSSTQGFINHCRIAHSRTFASHDAAAAASGEPVEVDEAGAVIGGNTDSSSTAPPGYVHPLIRSAHTIETPSKDNIQRSSVSDGATSKENTVGQSDDSVAESPRKKLEMTSPVTPDPAFKASPDTPHLSSLLAGLGLGLDLHKIVGDAKTAIDLDEFFSEGESEEEPESTTEASQDRPQLSVRGSRLPARTTMPQAASERPNSSKGLEKARGSNKPRHLDVSTPAKQASYLSSYETPSTSLGGLQLNGSQDVDMMDSAENLSPHTVESNQAPSLVSDDDDEYEALSDSERPSPSSSEAGDEEEEPDDIEVEDDEGAATSTTTDTKTDHDLANSARLKGGNGKKRDRVLPPTIVSLNRGKDGRRVSFVTAHSSPAKAKKDTNQKHNR